MQKCDVDWREQRSSLVEQNRHLLSSGLHSDCLFIVGPPDGDTEAISALKSMLWRASPVFEAMFHSGMSEDLCGEVRVTDVQPAIFKFMLQYIYCDELGVTCGEEALALSYAAHKYQLSHLLKKCVEYLCCHIEPLYVWQARELAELISHQELRDKCMEVVFETADESLSAEGFEEVDISVLCEVLREDRLNVTSEMTLVEAALRWARHHAKQEGLSGEPEDGVRDILGPAFPLLRFLTLKLEEFTEGPALEKWLSGDEKSCIFTNLIAPGKSEILPTLCAKTNPRLAPVSQLKPHAVWEVMKLPAYNPKTVFNNNNMECVLTFKVDKSILLQGFSVSSQLNKPLNELGEIVDCEIQTALGPRPSRGEVTGGRKGGILHLFQVESNARMNHQRSGVGTRRRMMASMMGSHESDVTPPDFLIAQNSSRNYIENVFVSIFRKCRKGKYNTYSVKSESIIEMQIQESRYYNCLNYLKFATPVLIEKTDDVNSVEDHFYVLTVKFFKSGYYETGDGVEMLRFGDVDFKFNVDEWKTPMLNSGLVKCFTFSAVDV